MFKKNINKNLKFSIYLVITIIITLCFSISIQSLLATWTAPTALPPEGNISGLLNEGINNQTKLGGLTIGGAFKADSIDNTLVVDASNNRVGIGKDDPDYKLDVNGEMRVKGETIGILSGSFGQFRAISGSYGIIHRNDGNNYNILLTSSGNQYGGFNTLRPFRINNATGDVFLGNNALFVDHSTGRVGIGDVSPDNGLKLDVEGKVGASDYCDQNGNNCTVATDLGGGIVNANMYDDAIIITEIKNGNFDPFKEIKIDVATIPGVNSNAKAIFIHINFRTSEGHQGYIGYKKQSNTKYKYICGSPNTTMTSNDNIKYSNLTHGQNFSNWYQLEDGKIKFIFSVKDGSPSLLMEIHGEIL